MEVVAIVAHPDRHLYGREVLQANLPPTTICRLRPWRKYEEIPERTPVVPTTIHARTPRRARSSMPTFIEVVLHVLQPKPTKRSKAASYFLSAQLWYLGKGRNLRPNARYPKRKASYVNATLTVHSVLFGVDDIMFNVLHCVSYVVLRGPIHE